VTANDLLAFPAVIAHATVENQSQTLSPEEIETITGPPADDRDFVRRTFDGLYFTPEDRAFLDSAWSHIDRLAGFKRSVAVSALLLAAARKQPRGVFTITTLRYDDGRRDLRLPLRQHFVECAAAYHEVIFDGPACRAVRGDVLDLDPAGFDLVYLDPPYAPPRDDTCYIKRYHFLEGLATYWRGQEIMWETRTRKLRKRHTPFASKRTVRPALDALFERFKDAALVVSYGSNAALDVTELEALLRRHKPRVRRIEIPHRYAFGTHASAARRLVREYVLVAA
jgi:DNA adenine methylase/adenine-specific DNA-methyltransferase